MEENVNSIPGLCLMGFVNDPLSNAPQEIVRLNFIKPFRLTGCPLRLGVGV